jgi:dTDP-glucose 4,6-dehydratase
MRFRNAVVFVTGGAGFIGSAVFRHLLDDTQACVVNIDKLTYAANLDSIPQAAGNPRCRFAQVDIGNAAALRALFEQHRPHYVMNLAAESHVDRSIDGPAEFIATNIVGTFTLLQEALRHWRALDAPSQARLGERRCESVGGYLGFEGFSARGPFFGLGIARPPLSTSRFEPLGYPQSLFLFGQLSREP